MLTLNQEILIESFLYFLQLVTHVKWASPDTCHDFPYNIKKF